MDYVKHYAALILRARTRTIDGHQESHHVVPRCMGGGDGKKNRVNLTPSEHYVAHLLLVRMFPKIPGLVLAAVMMSRDNRNGKRSNNKLYEWLRKRAAQAQAIQQTGRVNSPETRAKISAVLKASAAHAANCESLRSRPRSADTKLRLSDSHKNSEKAKAAREKLFQRKVGVPRSPETRAKISEKKTGVVMSEVNRQKISAALTGKPKSAEHNAKVSESLKGRVSPMIGRTHSEQTKERMRQAATGRKMSADAVANMVNHKTPEQRRAGALKAWETKRAKKAAADK